MMNMMMLPLSEIFTRYLFDYESTYYVQCGTHDSKMPIGPLSIFSCESRLIMALRDATIMSTTK